MILFWNLVEFKLSSYLSRSKLKSGKCASNSHEAQHSEAAAVAAAALAANIRLLFLPILMELLLRLPTLIINLVSSLDNKVTFEIKLECVSLSATLGFVTPTPTLGP